MMRFNFLCKVGFLFIWRSWRSTLALGVMIFSAVTALVFLSALAVGTNDAMIRNSVRLFSGHITAEDLGPDLSRDELNVDGVDGILIRKKRSIWLSHQDEMTAAVLMGVNPSEERQHTALWKKTVRGRYLEPGEAALYVSQAIASKLNVTVGDLVQIGFKPGSTVAEWVVCGIYQTGISYLDNGLVFCPMEVFPGADFGRSTAVFLADGTDCDRILATFRKLSGTSEFRAWSDFMPDLKQLIDLNFVSMGIVMVLVFGIVSLGIACAFVIFILKNLREHGIMKAMGILPTEAVLLIVTQVAVLTLAASLSGDVAGALAVLGFARIGIDLTAFTSHNQYFVVSGIIYPRLTFYSLFWPPVLAMVFGLLAAVWPSVFVIHKKAADILRAI
jgi:ABC-type lipoprotein release transport system permease subunit